MEALYCKTKSLFGISFGKSQAPVPISRKARGFTAFQLSSRQPSLPKRSIIIGNTTRYLIAISKGDPFPVVPGVVSAVE